MPAEPIDGGRLMTEAEYKALMRIPDTYNPNPTMARCADGVTRWK